MPYTSLTSLISIGLDLVGFKNGSSLNLIQTCFIFLPLKKCPKQFIQILHNSIIPDMFLSHPNSLPNSLAFSRISVCRNCLKEKSPAQQQPGPAPAPPAASFHSPVVNPRWTPVQAPPAASPFPVFLPPPDLFFSHSKTSRGARTWPPWPSSRRAPPIKPASRAP